MKTIQLDSYFLAEINESELVLINGGSETSYNIGQAVGTTVRTFIDATGKAVSWMNDILFGKLFNF